MGLPAPSSRPVTRQRPVPDPIRQTPQALVPVAEVLIDNPPDSRGPGEWVVAEGVCIAMLRRHYGWVSPGPGQLVRVRPGFEDVRAGMLGGSIDTIAS